MKTRVDVLLQWVQNHKVLAFVIVLGIAVIAVAKALGSGREIVQLVIPSPQPSVADVLVGEVPRAFEYRIVVHNPSPTPALVTRVHIKEESWDTVPRPRGVVIQCAPIPPFIVRDVITLRSTGAFAGRVGEKGSDFEVPVDGQLDLGCSSYRSLSFGFSAQIKIGGAEQVTIAVVLPKALKIAFDSVNLFRNRLPSGSRLRVDSFMVAHSRTRSRTLAVLLTTSDGRQLRHSVDRKGE